MKKYTDKEWFREKYVEEDLNMYEMAQICGVDKSTISYWKKKHDINQITSYKDVNKEELRRLYREKKLSAYEIAEKWNVGDSSVRNWLRRFEIGVREPHPGERKTELTFTNSVRKSIYERDDYTCQDCGQIGGELNAHHIEMVKNKPELAQEKENGVTLCVECHYKKHKNKKDKKATKALKGYAKKVGVEL